MIRNPNWTRDELILALDLYFAGKRTQLDSEHPDVIALSQLLSELPIHPPDARAANFRNPRSVSMKLGNFLACDPAYPGVGLSRGGKLDQKIWDEFAYRREELNRVAQAIRDTYATTEARPPAVDEDEPDEEFPEGTLLTRIHRRRERNRKSVRRKKKRVLKQTGRLACEVCDFDFVEAYGELGDGFAECHHIVPLAELGENQRTTLSDLAIVCANCHRMLHRGNPPPCIEELRAIVNIH